MASITIEEILGQVKNGQIRIPSFQRGFVWDADRVAYLMDSIYKEFPFGSLLLWQSKERLNVDRDLGPFKSRSLRRITRSSTYWMASSGLRRFSAFSRMALSRLEMRTGSMFTSI